MNIYVTGLGVVSAIGLNAHENLHSLKHEKTGIEFSEKYKEQIGLVNRSNEDLAEDHKLVASEYSRTTLLSLTAAKEALKNFPKELNSSLALISATSVGGVDRTEVEYFNSQDNKEIYISRYNSRYDNGLTTDKVAIELGVSGYINTISTACSSSANAILMGARLIRSGKFNRVLVGGADPVAQLNVSGFRSLGVYDDSLCKPFDKDRKGLNLGEGAAFLLLENDESIKESGSERQCKLTGWANTADSFHQTASSENGIGANLSMSQAMKVANLQAVDISYINAHGTSTMNNDNSESMAISDVFGSNVPRFSSTKCYTGHTLAASGAIEAVYCVLSIVNKCIFSTNTFKATMEIPGLSPESKFIESAELDHVLSNSFGFGGNCTSLIFSSIQ